MISKKSALLMPSGPRHDPDRKHLFIVLTNPCPKQDQLLVSISSYRDDGTCDETCVLDAGCHEFIIRPSFVEYRRARLVGSEALVRGVRLGTLVMKAPLDDDLFDNIRDGLMSSVMAPRKFQGYLYRYRDL